MVTAIRPQLKSPPAKRKVGRPKIAKARYCKRCGKKLNVRPARIREGLGNFCQPCFNYLFRPPTVISGSVRKKAGGPVCPHCHSFQQIYRDDSDTYCRVCGCLITSEIISYIPNLRSH